MMTILQRTHDWLRIEPSSQTCCFKSLFAGILFSFLFFIALHMTILPRQAERENLSLEKKSLTERKEELMQQIAELRRENDALLPSSLDEDTLRHLVFRNLNEIAPHQGIVRLRGSE